MRHDRADCMRDRSSWLLPAVVGFTLLVSPGVQGQTPPKPPPMADGGTWDNGERNEPALSILVNPAARGQLVRGWPALIRVELWHPRFANPKAEPMKLAVNDGTWTAMVKLEITDAQGKTLSWPLQLAPVPEKSITLDATRGGQVIWWLSPEQTANIPEGDYRLLAALDTTQSPVKDCWKGKAVSDPLPVHLQNAPELSSKELQAARNLLLASYHLVRKDAKQAAAAVNDLLQIEPNHIHGLTLKGDLLAADGKAAEAYSTYQQAVEAHHKKFPKSKEPPLFLLNKQKALLDKLIRDP